MQSRSMTVVEIVAGKIISVALAIVTQIIIFPLYGLEVSVDQNVSIAVIFTAVATVKSFCVRRFFNRLEARKELLKWQRRKQ